MSSYKVMNKQIRQVAKVEMTRHGYSQTELAEALHMSRGHLNRMLSDSQQRKGETVDTWRALLAALGLKLVAVPKAFPVPEETVVDEDKSSQTAELEKKDERR